MSHIFFSYSRKDRDIAESLVARMRAAGYVVWQDVSSIRGGENWWRAIQQGITDAATVVVLWSKHASGSNWVNKEIDIAQTQGKPVLPVLADDTALPAGLSVHQGIPANDHKRLIRDLPPEMRRQRSGLAFGSAIDGQTVDGVERWHVEGVGDLVSVPLLRSSYCNAAVVAPPGTVISGPENLHLCLQFSRAVDKVMVSDVFRQVRAEMPDVPFMALHITGPVDLKGYELDNHNPAQWLDAVDTATEALNELSKTRRPELHVYFLTPNALAFAIGTQLWRFWRITVYNYVIPSGPYVRVLELASER